MIVDARIPEPLATRYAALVESIRACGRVVVAFSGGVDSAFLLGAAVEALGPDARVVLGTSASVPAEVLERARRMADGLGAPLELVPSGELDDPAYLANAPDRCFHCKNHLYSLLGRLARESGGATVLDGTNHDDLSDSRPGLRALELHGVRSPLAEQGWTKAEIREASQALGLETWDRPSSPCLSSRIPHGTPVTGEALGRIDAAEAFLRGLGFEEVRVRHHAPLARIEVPADRISDLVAVREAVVAGLRSVGYGLVVLDLAGYRSGGADSIETPDRRANADEGGATRG